jgi:hypothetical protein
VRTQNSDADGTEEHEPLSLGKMLALEHSRAAIAKALNRPKISSSTPTAGI